ncbi:MAG TPA: DinB family protein [Chitinophaga sp.]
MLYPALQERLNSQHLALVHILQGLPDAQLRRQVKPGKWSIHQQVAHLAAIQPVYGARFTAIAASTAPVPLVQYVGDDDPLFLALCGQPLPAVLFNLSEGRLQLQELAQGFTAEDLGKTCTHPLYGKLSLRELLEFFVLHEAHHLFEIFKMAHTTAPQTGPVA